MVHSYYTSFLHRLTPERRLRLGYRIDRVHIRDVVQGIYLLNRRFQGNKGGLTPEKVWQICEPYSFAVICASDIGAGMNSSGVNFVVCEAFSESAIVAFPRMFSRERGLQGSWSYHHAVGLLRSCGPRGGFSPFTCKRRTSTRGPQSRAS